jgi:hypothetical protein
MSKFTPAGLALMLLACATSPKPPSAQYGGVIYPQLTAEGLRTAIVGQAFSFPAGEVITAPRCQGFNDDGSYFQCGDRVPIITGRYVVQQDRVCATTGPYMSCWQLFGGPKTDYMLRHLRDDGVLDERVCIRPVKAEAKPRF